MKIKNLQELLKVLDPEMDIVWTDGDLMCTAEVQEFLLSDKKNCVLIRPGMRLKGDPYVEGLLS